MTKAEFPFMRSVFLSLLLCAPLAAQQINPGQIRGTAVVQTPAGAQTVTQPVNTNLNLHTSGTGSVVAPSLNYDIYLSASSELSAQVNAAVATLNASGGAGRIHLPTCTACTWTGNATINSAGISLVGTGVLSSVINCTYIGDCLDLYPVYGLALRNAAEVGNFHMIGINGTSSFNITAWSITSGIATFTAANSLVANQPVILGGFGTSTFFNGVQATVLPTGLSGTHFEAYFTHANGSATESGTGTINQNIIHGRDLLGYNLFNLYLDYAGETGGSCLELEDYQYWTEANTIKHLETGYNCKKGLRLFANSQTNFNYCPASNPSAGCSFGYNDIDILDNPIAGMTGISMEGSAQLYYGFLHVRCNEAGSSGNPGVAVNIQDSFLFDNNTAEVNCEENGTGDILWQLSGTARTQNLGGHAQSDQTLVNNPTTLSIDLTDGGQGADWTQHTFIPQGGQPFDFHAGGAYLIPAYSADNFENGVGLNGRFQYTSGNFICFAAGPHNGCSFILENTVGTAGATIYVIPDTGTGLNQSFTYAALASHAILNLSPSGATQVLGNLVVSNGANTVYRCTTAGTLPVGALTVVAGNCGASVALLMSVN